MSPDGSEVAFLSNRSTPQPQIYVQQLDRPGDAVRLSSVGGAGVSDLSWPARGDAFLFSSEVYVDELGCTDPEALKDPILSTANVCCAL